MLIDSTSIREEIMIDLNCRCKQTKSGQTTSYRTNKSIKNLELVLTLESLALYQSHCPVCTLAQLGSIPSCQHASVAYILQSAGYHVEEGGTFPFLLDMVNIFHLQY